MSEVLTLSEKQNKRKINPILQAERVSFQS